MNFPGSIWFAAAGWIWVGWVACGNSQTPAPLPLPDRVELKEEAPLPAGIPERIFQAWMVEEGEREVVVELSKFRGITSRVRVDRELIARIERGDPAERPFAELAPYLSPPPDAADAGPHRTVIMTRLAPFLARFPEAPQSDLVRESKDLHEAELLRLAGGEVKINHRWFRVDALEPVDHEALRMLRENPRALNEPVEAFGRRVMEVARLSSSEFFPELARSLDAVARRRLIGTAQSDATKAVSAARLQSALSTREAVLIGQIETIVNQEPLGGTAFRPASVVGKVYNEVTGKWYDATDLNTSLFTEFMIPDGRPKRALREAEIGQLRQMVNELAALRREARPAPRMEDGVGRELNALTPLRQIDVSALEESIRAVQEVQDRVRAGLRAPDPELVALLTASTKTVKGGTAHLRLAKELPQHAAGGSETDVAAWVDRTLLALQLSAIARESLPGGSTWQDGVRPLPASWQRVFDESITPRFVAEVDQMAPDAWADQVTRWVGGLAEYRAALAPETGSRWTTNVLRIVLDQSAEEGSRGDAALALRRLTTAEALLAKPDGLPSHARTTFAGEIEAIRRRIRTRLLEEEAPAFRARLQELASARDYAALHDTLQERWRRLAAENPEPPEVRAFSDLVLEHARAALLAFAPVQTYRLVSLARDIEPNHGQINLWISGGVVGVFAVLVALALPAFWVMSLIATYFDNLRFKFRVGALRKPKRTVLPKS